MSLKSRKSQIKELNPTVLQVKNGKPVLFDLYSPTSNHWYSISLTEKGNLLKIHCRDKSEHSNTCDGNYWNVCKHTFAVVIKWAYWQGLKVALCETWESAKRLLNLYARKGGKLVEIKGNGGSKWGVVHG